MDRFTPSGDNPVLTQVIRGSIVESEHRGCAIAVDSSGEIIFAAGDYTKPVYPRSAMKLFQALPLLETGAGSQFDLSDADLALACSSHNGEVQHVQRVVSWLERLDLTPDDLECGPALSISPKIYREQVSNGVEPSRAHHNCSGKHAGMLTVARTLDVETSGYSLHGHPVQDGWMRVASELTDLDVSNLPWERDGCGLPAVAMPLENLALGFARFSGGSGQSSTRLEAMSRILTAIKNHPEMIAGTGRCCSAVARHTDGKVIVKTGAEGVFGGCIPGKGIGFALKIDDGATRASEVALGALIRKLGVADVNLPALNNWFAPEIFNSQDFKTGSIQPSDTWD